MDSALEAIQLLGEMPIVENRTDNLRDTQHFRPLSTCKTTDKCSAQDKYRMSIGSVWDEYGISMASGKKRFGKTGVDCGQDHSTNPLRKMVRNGKGK